MVPVRELSNRDPRS